MNLSIGTIFSCTHKYISRFEIIKLSFKLSIGIAFYIYEYFFDNLIQFFFSIYPIFDCEFEFGIGFCGSRYTQKRFFFPLGIFWIVDLYIGDIKI